jgi:uncharacterized repeat protein (TIGR03806 family)
MATFHPFRTLRNAAIVATFGGVAYLGFLWWHQDQVALDGRVVNTTLNMPTAPRSVTNWTLVPVDVGRQFKKVTRLISASDDHLYLLEQNGRIYRLSKPFDSAAPKEFLRLRNVLAQGEGGLLGFALHPDFGDENSPNGRHAYVYYSAQKEDGGRSNRLSRFTAKPNLKKLDPSSELILIDQDDEDVWHDGGDLAFGSDGFLYLTMGDEGLSSDALGNSQKITKDLYSGVLRLDVDQTGGTTSHPAPRQPDTGTTAHYMIPNDNPFVGVPDALEEFYAIGFRNPHNLHLDHRTGNAFVTDVGENQREELNLLIKGGNYQWSFREGELLPTADHLEDGQLPSPLYGTQRAPLLAYSHTNGNKCIIGGFVYHGDVFPELQGAYIFGDLTSGRLWAATLSNDQIPELEERVLLTHLEAREARSLCALAATSDGEIYTATLAGTIHRLERRTSQDDLVSLPKKLSDTGVFSDVTSLQPAPGFIPYEVNSPLWSDGAIKRRWICVPGDGTSANPARDRVVFNEDHSWTFPPGTCFVKHFELPLDDRDKTKTKRLETRIIMRDEAAGIYGVTYKWNDQGTEALLLEEGMEERHDILCADGATRNQTWSYPSGVDCLTCHTEEAGFVLGVNTRQLNSWAHYPETNRDGHQLRTWNSIGLLTRSQQEVETLDPTSYFGLPSLVDPYDHSENIDNRMASYFDTNCAHCHRPFMMRTALDLRWGIDDTNRHLFDEHALNPMTRQTTLLVNTEDPQSSEMLKRIAAKESSFRMPPLSTSVPDQEAIALVEQWIASKQSPQIGN